MRTCSQYIKGEEFHAATTDRPDPNTATREREGEGGVDEKQGVGAQPGVGKYMKDAFV